MLKLLFSIVTCFLFCLITYGQDKNLNRFVPVGFSIMDKSKGDFTGDGIIDVILALKSRDENSNTDAARPLLILQGTGKGQYKLITRNDSVVLCLGCGGVHGDPYAGVTIKRHYFSIEHLGGSGWRWTRVMTFKYDPKTKTLALHRDAGYSWHVSDPNKTTESVFNKEDFDKLPFAKFRNTKNW